jgi:hypothetical protein
MLKKVIKAVQREIFGERAKGEKVFIPNLKHRHRELDKRLSSNDDREAFNRWCYSVNFSGMYTKH